MTDPSNELRETARLWAIRAADPAFEGWDAFTDWLGADPAHAAAYDAACDAHERVDALFPVPEPIVVVAQRPTRRRALWIGAGGAIAAALAVTIGIEMTGPAAAPYTIETAPGARRTVALADGSTIELNGGTRLVLDKAAPRLASLERGQALFHVRHDTDDPFVVTIGEDRLVDAGTVFDVVRDPRATRVQVAEGKVIYNPDTNKLMLNAGSTLVIERDSVTLGRMPTGDIGGWRRGTLAYANMPLRSVAADLSRNLGRRIAVAPAIAEQRFTGTIALGDEAAGATLTRIAPLLGVVPEPKGDGWTLTSPNRAQP